MSYPSMERHVRLRIEKSDCPADLFTTLPGFFALYQGTTLVVP
jgi:hypothetical protein